MVGINMVAISGTVCGETREQIFKNMNYRSLIEMVQRTKKKNRTNVSVEYSCKQNIITGFLYLKELIYKLIKWFPVNLEWFFRKQNAIVANPSLRLDNTAVCVLR